VLIGKPALSPERGSPEGLEELEEREGIEFNIDYPCHPTPFLKIHNSNRTDV